MTLNIHDGRTVAPHNKDKGKKTLNKSYTKNESRWLMNSNFDQSASIENLVHTATTVKDWIIKDQ